MIILILPDIPSEDALLASALHGDQDAIRRVYQAYFPPIYQFIRLRVEDRALAEDLASEVFVKFIGALRTPAAPRKSLRGWLFRVARNEIYQHFGKVKTFPATTLDEWIPAPASDDPEMQLVRSLDADRVRDALRQLSDDQQEVLILRFGQALSPGETADVMGKSVAAVKVTQFRALKRLRGLLKHR
jgi:RNA polymerase sigma-70 factor (ECF subfamily)